MLLKACPYRNLSNKSIQPGPAVEMNRIESNMAHTRFNSSPGGACSIRTRIRFNIREYSGIIIRKQEPVRQKARRTCYTTCFFSQYSRQTSSSIVSSLRACLCDERTSFDRLKTLSTSHDVAGMDRISKAILASLGKDV